MNSGLKVVIAALTVAMGGTLASLTLEPARAQPATEHVVVDESVVGTGYRTSELTGKPVVNEKNERVGTIDDFVIGRDRVLFSILQVGGFLGIGSRLVAVPYRSLALDEEGEKITLQGATKEQLQRLAEFKYL